MLKESWTNRQVFEMGIDQVIDKLINGAKPASDPGMTAWEWFKSTGGDQEPQVNEYMLTQINSKTTSVQNCIPTGNWQAWSFLLNDAMAAPDVPSKVTDWFKLVYTGSGRDLPTVPPDVLDWTQKSLPTVTKTAAVL